jgi:hypothetical protein
VSPTPVVVAFATAAAPAIKRSSSPSAAKLEKPITVAMEFEVAKALLEHPLSKYPERPYRLGETIR